MGWRRRRRWRKRWTTRKRARLTWILDHCSEKSCKSINLLLCSLKIELLAVLSFLFAIHVRFQVLFSLLIKPDFDQWRGRIPQGTPIFPVLLSYISLTKGISLRNCSRRSVNPGRPGSETFLCTVLLLVGNQRTWIFTITF